MFPDMDISPALLFLLVVFDILPLFAAHINTEDKIAQFQFFNTISSSLTYTNNTMKFFTLSAIAALAVCVTATPAGHME